jgi:hypothetical protein
MLGSYCLVAITGFGLGIIYNHDENNDEATPILSMFMLLVMLITRLYVLIGTWRTPGKQCNHNTIWLWSWLIN